MLSGLTTSGEYAGNREGFAGPVGSQDQIRKALGYSDFPEHESAQADLFSLSKVQYALPNRLTHLCCASNTLYLAVSGSALKIIRINLEKADEEIVITLPPISSTTSTAAVSSNASHKLHRIFVDPSGQHLLINTLAHDNFYFYTGWAFDKISKDPSDQKRAKMLTKLKGLAVESVSWTMNVKSSKGVSNSSTKEMLLGTADGRIFETSIDGEIETGTFSRNAHDRYLRPVLLLENRQAILGLQHLVWQLPGSSKRRLAIIATTDTKILQYCCGVVASDNTEEGIFASVGQLFQESSCKILELPGALLKSELHFFQPKRPHSGILEPPQAVAWSTGAGLYHGNVLYSSQEPGDGIIEGAQLLPYPTVSYDLARNRNTPSDPSSTPSANSELPLSIAITEHHLILTYSKHVSIIRVLDDEVVFEEYLPLRADETLLGLATDRSSQTYWVFSNSSIFELSVQDEDRDIWSVFLHRQAYDTALQVAKTGKQRDLILTAKADAFYASAKYIQAADLYAQTSKSFEEVVLDFSDKTEKDALRTYLSSRLSRLAKTAKFPRLMLATWLLENTLGKINELEDASYSEGEGEAGQNLALERSILEEDARGFLQTYKDDLDRMTVYDILSSHGRSDLLLHFAEIVGDHWRIIQHWIQEDNWVAALKSLVRQPDVELYYSYAATLLRNAMEPTLEAFQRQPALELPKLLPALLCVHLQVPEKTPALAKYLEQSLASDPGSEAPSHNALLQMHARLSENGGRSLLLLLERLNDDLETGLPRYDLDYALRLCQMFRCHTATIYVYGKMAMWDSAVDLALEIGDVTLAKVYADRPGEIDVTTQKRLWLRIAAFVVGRQHDVKSVATFLEDAHLLQIEDLLPFFPDFVVIDDFKSEISGALEKYSTDIERLKDEMSEATRNADLIKHDISDLSSRLLVLDATERCTFCSAPLLTRQFYVFPCHHAFHADCLIKEMTPLLPQHALRRLVDLQSRHVQSDVRTDSTSSTASPATFNFIPKGKVATMGFQSVDQLRKLVIPDVLVNVIGASADGLVEGVNEAMKLAGATSTKRNGLDLAKGPSIQEQEQFELLRNEVDDLLAATCVLCERSLGGLDLPFLKAGESMEI